MDQNVLGNPNLKKKKKKKKKKKEKKRMVQVTNIILSQFYDKCESFAQTIINPFFKKKIFFYLFIFIY